MNAPPSPSAPVEALAVFVTHCAELAGLYATHARELAEACDYTGAARSMRMLAMVAVKGCESLPALKAAVEQRTQLGEAARAAAKPELRPAEPNPGKGS